MLKQHSVYIAAGTQTSFTNVIDQFFNIRIQIQIHIDTLTHVNVKTRNLSS